MRSSTNISITCPLLNEEQKDELFTLLESLDDYWLKREYWQVREYKNTCNIYVEENGIDYDLAEDLADIILEDFLSEYFLGENCSVSVNYTQMNADGYYGWSINCKDGVCTHEYKEEICEEYVSCPKCGKFFEIDFDYEEAYGDYDDYEEDIPEETITCPECGNEMTKRGSFLYSVTTEEWKK